MHPFLFVTTPFQIPTYLVINSLAFCIGVIWIYQRGRRQGIEGTALLDVELFFMIAAFLGARLFHIFFEQPAYYFHHPSAVYKIWLGGFVYYGGVMGGALGAWLTCHYKKIKFLKAADVFAPVIAFGTALGRVGCLAAGCCYGAPTLMPWGISFPPGVEAPAGIALHPTQVYSSLWDLFTMVILLTVERHQTKSATQVSSQHDGFTFGLWLLLYGFGRAVIEQFRGDFRGPAIFNLSVSTWLSGVAIILGTYLLGTRRQS